MTTRIIAGILALFLPLFLHAKETVLKETWVQRFPKETGELHVRVTQVKDGLFGEAQIIGTGPCMSPMKIMGKQQEAGYVFSSADGVVCGFSNSTLSITGTISDVDPRTYVGTVKAECCILANPLNGNCMKSVTRNGTFSIRLIENENTEQ